MHHADSRVVLAGAHHGPLEILPCANADSVSLPVRGGALVVERDWTTSHAAPSPRVTARVLRQGGQQEEEE